MATGIEWTDATWNPVTGCSHVSPGCEHCYAEALSLRYGWSKKPWTAPNAAENVVLHPDRLDKPLTWRKPQRVFVNSMSDLFHEQVPDEFIDRVFAVMALTPQHTYQVLTKRPERMRAYIAADRMGHVEHWAKKMLRERSGDPGKPVLVGKTLAGTWPWSHVWLGVSVEDQRRADERIPLLLQTPAGVRFLSCEPLLGPVDVARYLTPEPKPRAFDLFCATPERAREIRDAYRRVGPKLIHWVIAGGESGPNHRSMDLDWARSLRDQCQAAGVAYLFKQVGGRTPKAGGRLLDGRTWDEYPQAVPA